MKACQAGEFLLCLVGLLVRFSRNVGLVCLVSERSIGKEMEGKKGKDKQLVQFDIPLGLFFMFVLLLVLLL